MLPATFPSKEKKSCNSSSQLVLKPHAAIRYRRPFQAFRSRRREAEHFVGRFDLKLKTHITW